MSTSLLVAIAIFIALIGIGIGIGIAVQFIGDRVADRVTDTDHEMINGSPL